MEGTSVPFIFFWQSSSIVIPKEIHIYILMSIKDSVEEKLKTIAIEDNGRRILLSDTELVDNIVIANDKVYLSLKANKSEIDKFNLIKSQIEKELLTIDGITNVSVSLTSHSINNQSNSEDHTSQKGVSNIKNIIAVASGKGGVGKSTTSINLAISMSKLGYNVGLLDADIYGPSIPKLVGDNQKPKISRNGNIMPINKFSLSLMSIGFLISEDTPMIWRGPMVISAVNQMLNDVEWGNLDYLIIDMPPGTGDVQLTIAQRLPMRGAIIVSTPQDLALIDAKKGVEMFKKVNVPILGIIENMSTFICPNCSHETHIFGHDGAKFESINQGVDFLGAIPLEIELRKSSDAGIPIVDSNSDSDVAKKFLNIANMVTDKINSSPDSKIPNIVIN